MDKKMRKERDLSSTQEGREGERGGSLRHVEAVIKSDISVADFLSQISTVQTPPTTTTTSTAQQEEAGLILTGLHPCGDLCTTILRIFARSNQVVGVVCVGCCYMKLTTLLNHTPSIDHTSSGGHTPSKDHASSSGHTPSSDHTSMGECEGYPMSRFLKECGHILSYEARELACHSIATYKERFKGERLCGEVTWTLPFPSLPSFPLFLPLSSLLPPLSSSLSLPPSFPLDPTPFLPFLSSPLPSFHTSLSH